MPGRDGSVVTTAPPVVGGPPTAKEPPATRRKLTGLALGLVIAAAGLAAAMTLSMAVGSNQLPLGDVWRVFWSPDDSFTSVVVQSRIPRTVLGVVVGVALAVAGAVIQGITRNPLGDPGLLGVNAGASASVVTVLALAGGATGFEVWSALPGALLAAVVVFVVGSGRRGPTPVRLILAGAAVSAVLMAYIQGVALMRPDVFDSYRIWAVGSLGGRPAAVLEDIVPFVAVAVVVALLLSRGLNAIALGDATATSLGLNPARTKLLAGAAAVVLCAAATAAAGPIAFVGLAVPHIVRSFTGPDHRWLLPYCALVGPTMLLAADVLGRAISRPGEIVVGAVTAFVGAPFLIAAVRRRGSGV